MAGNPKPERPWREIAKEVTNEADSDKVLELSQELLEALDKENKPHPHQTREHDEQARRKSA